MREFGDVWISLDEVGAPEPEPEMDADESKDGEEVSNVPASFFSFEASVEEQKEDRAKPKEPEKKEKEKPQEPEKPTAPPEKLELLPELTLPGLLQERADKYRHMQVEAKEMETNTRSQLK